MSGTNDNSSFESEMPNLDWLVNKSFTPSSVKGKLPTSAKLPLSNKPDDYSINKRGVKSNLGGIYKFDVPEYPLPKRRKFTPPEADNPDAIPKILRYFSSQSEKIVRDSLPAASPLSALSKDCLANPQDCEQWLRLVREQDVEYTNQYDSSEHSTVRTRRLVERKLAVIERAISHNPTGLPLLLERLLLLGQIEDHVTVRRQYDQLLLTHTGQPLFWQRYIHFVKSSSVSNFGFLRTTRLYEKGISTLLVGTGRRLPPEDSAIIDLIMSYAEFLSNCGYLERSVTLLQSLIELNRRTGDVVTDLRGLEEHFRSGSLLIGEDSLPVEVDETLPIGRVGLHREQLWLYLEHLREQNHWTSVRDGECEDVDRVVSFSDLQSTLCQFSSQEHLLLTCRLMVSLTQFVPLLPGESDFDDMFFYGLFLQSGVPVGKREGSARFVGNVLDVLEKDSLEVVERLHKDVLLREFVQADHRGEDVGPLRQKTRRILGRLRNSLELYGFYMFLEYVEGNAQAGRKVFRAVVDRCARSAAPPYKFICQWVELELGFSSSFHIRNDRQMDCDEAEALGGLTIAAILHGKGRPGNLSTSRLEATRIYRRGNFSDVHLCQCNALFNLLTRGWDHCESIYMDYIARSRRFVPPFMALVRSLHRRGRLSTARVCGLLRSCIPIVSDDFTLLSVVAEVGLSLLSTQTCRRLFMESWRQSSHSPKVIMAHIRYEMDNLVLSYGAGLVNRIRKLFNDYCLLPEAGSCPFIWRWFMRFERDYGTRNNLNSVYYRGVQTCPWCKDLYMDFICYSPDSMDEVVGVMLEKGVRVRVPIEEIELIIGIETKRAAEGL